jgi:hypothetical protein
MILLASYTFLNLYLHNIGCRTIEAQWHDIVSGTFLREALTEAVAMARHHQVNNWIADDRRLGPLSPDDLAWVAANILPALADMGLKRLALVEAADPFNNELIQEAYSPSMETLSFEMRRFTDLQDARAWTCGLPIKGHK